MNSDHETKPKLVAPVMRYLPVTDIQRSLTFYHDVLGFEIHGGAREEYGVSTIGEVTSGAARIQFTMLGRPSGGEPNAGACKVLFFEADGVAPFHAAVAQRGGNPSELERVNWIKMEMFQVTDPDRHTLWFGQSFDKFFAPAKDPMVLKALPELPFNDVPAALAHYRDVLGFRVNYAQHDLAVMDRDKITIILIARTDKYSGIGSCYVYISDADSLYAELRQRAQSCSGNR